MRAGLATLRLCRTCRSSWCETTFERPDVLAWAYGGSVDRDLFLERLSLARRHWDGVMGCIPSDRITEGGLPGGWSVKDVVAHITWSEREMIGVLRQRALVGSPLWSLDQDTRNAAIYAENRDRALGDVLADEQRVYAELLPLLEALTTEDLTDPARFDRMIPGVPPWRIFAGNTFLHYEEHACAVREWLRASEQGE
jgi:hypothetical protein